MKRNEPIRVAQIMGKLWAGGVEMVVFNYYRAIDKSKVQFDFYYDADSTVEPPQDLIDMGARFIKVPPYQKLPQYIKTLKRHFKENNYKIVHSHINTLSVFPLFSAWTCHIPVRIAHNHSVPGGNEFKRNALKYFLRLFAKVFATDYFACSEKAGRWMFGDTTFEKGKVLLMRNAIDFDRFRPDQDFVESRKKDLEIEDKYVIGCIGRFTFAKNHKFLINVFSEIIKKRDDVVLLLVGDGELRSDIVRWIKEKNIQDNTILVGQVADPENYYRLCNVVAVPSLFEGLSLTTIESQIAGVPVVISNAVPDEAIISNGVTKINDTNSVSLWVSSLMSEKVVSLNDSSQDYNIENAVIKVEEWYLRHGRKKEVTNSSST